jgi:hypothetical protein
MDLPYPKLETFAQSLVDTNSFTRITDLVGGVC